MSPDKEAQANQEVQNRLALGLMQPSFSPWDSEIVMVKMKTGELRIFCHFRPLIDVKVKDAFLLPRLGESLSGVGNAIIFTSIDLARSRVSLACSFCGACILGYAILG